MRSHWIRVGPKFNINWCSYKKQTHKKKIPCDVRGRLKICCHKLRNTQGYQKLETAREYQYLEALKEALASNLYSDPSLQNCERIIFISE